MPINPAAIRTAVRKISRRERLLHGNISVVFVSDPVIKKLNRRFLKKKYATDVLAFDYSAEIPPRKGKGVYGEVIISADRAAAQAKVYGTTLKHELTLYVVHGILHLLGFDDHAAKDIRRMRRKENELMQFLKIPAPRP